MSDDEDNKMTTVVAPFDRPDANCVLHSNPSDADFRVHKCMLSFASPFFEDMFTVPQPSSSSRNDLPVIPMDEDKTVIEALLRLCYPYPMPVFTSVKGVRDVLEATRKYQIDGAADKAQFLLLPLVSASTCLEIYVLSCSYGLRQPAEAAAIQLLKQSMTRTPLLPDMDRMSAAAYHQLLAYRWECGEIAAGLVNLEQQSLALGEHWVWWSCANGSRCPKVSVNYRLVHAGGIPELKYRSYAQWWEVYRKFVCDELRAGSPYVATIKDRSIIELCLKFAEPCAPCRALATLHLKEFGELWIEKIEEAIANVSLDFTP